METTKDETSTPEPATQKERKKTPYELEKEERQAHHDDEMLKKDEEIRTLRIELEETQTQLTDERTAHEKTKKFSKCIERQSVKDRGDVVRLTADREAMRVEYAERCKELTRANQQRSKVVVELRDTRKEFAAHKKTALEALADLQAGVNIKQMTPEDIDKLTETPAES